MVNNDFFDNDLISSSNIINKFEEEIDVSESKLETKSLQIQQLITQFEYRLQGFSWKGNGEKYYYSGNPLAGESLIQKIMATLHPFSREIILISSKNSYSWAKQLWRTRDTFLRLITTELDSDIKNNNIIWRSLTNLMFNIGDIIGQDNSKEFLEKYFGMRKDNDDFGGYPVSNNNSNINSNNNKGGV